MTPVRRRGSSRSTDAIPTGARRNGSRARVLADLAQTGRDRGAQPARAVGAQVPDETGPWPPRLFEGDLDARVFALLAVIEDGDDPVDLRALGIVGRVVIDAVVGELLHRRSVAREALACGPCGTRSRR